ncbi:hypothetical protein ACWGJP_01900 [Microbacterium sp. NPDC055903]
MARRGRVDGTAGRALLIGLVIVLAVVAVVLTALAFLRVGAERGDGDVAPVPTFGVPEATPSVAATPSASPAAPEPVDRAQERFIAVGSEAVWRGVAGACGGVAPLLERSTDGGETWTDVTPTYLGIGQLLAVTPFSGSEAQIVAAVGDACEVQALRTFTQGEFWESYPEVLTTADYVDLAGGIVLGGETVASPCSAPLGLHISDASAAVVCDGVAFAWESSAWAPIGAAGAVAAVPADDGYVVARKVDACDGILISRSGVATGAAETCAEVVDASASMTIAVDGDEVLIWSGDEWLRTSD